MLKMTAQVIVPAKVMIAGDATAPIFFQRILPTAKQNAPMRQTMIAFRGVLWCRSGFLAAVNATTPMKVTMTALAESGVQTSSLRKKSERMNTLTT